MLEALSVLAVADLRGALATRAPSPRGSKLLFYPFDAGFAKRWIVHML